MNSKIKGIIAGGVVVCCLGATLAVLELTGKPDDSSSTDVSSVESSLLEDETLFQLTSINKDSIALISFENQYGTLNIERDEGSGGEDTSWSLKELGGVNPNGTAIKACVNICSELKGKQLVEENVSDKAKYGLESPSARVAVSVDGGNDTVILIGDEIPTGGYRYVMLEGDTSVYTAMISNVNYFLQKAEYFCSLSLVYTPSDNAWPEIERLTIKRSDLDYDMVFVTVPEDDAPIGMVSTQAMIKPVYAGLDITNSAAVTHGIWGLQAAEAAVLHPTEEDMKEYALDAPDCTVILDTDKEDYTLKVGKAIYAKDENGEETTEVAGYYCYINAEGTDCIYAVEKENCPWASVLPEDIIGGQMVGSYIMDLEEISVIGEDTNSVVDINAVEETDDTSEVFEVKINGKTVDGDIFKDWYVYWLECPADETYFQPLTGEETLYLTVTLREKDGDERIVKFYHTSGRRLIVEIDGNVGYKIPISYAQVLIDNLERVSAGEAIVSTY